MLVLSRTEGQSILIGDTETRVKLLRARRGVVTLAIGNEKPNRVKLSTEGEAFIGDNVMIVVSKVGFRRASIGIDADVDVPIYREKLKKHFQERTAIPDVACPARAGSAAKIETLRLRVLKGQALYHPNDEIEIEESGFKDGKEYIFRRYQK